MVPQDLAPFGFLSLVLSWSSLAAVDGEACGGLGASPWNPYPIRGPTVLDITTFGAVGDNETLNTVAIQHAIDSAAAAGGGYARVPRGAFLTG